MVKISLLWKSEREYFEVICSPWQQVKTELHSALRGLLGLEKSLLIFTVNIFEM